MKKLLAQIIKFGFVGGLCFLIDFAISTVLFHMLNGIVTKKQATAIGGAAGFTISVIVNYVLSMKYVFTRKEDMGRKKEFVIFVILSVVGLGINEVILLLCSNLYEGNVLLKDAFHNTVWLVLSKVGASAPNDVDVNEFADTLWFAISKVIATAIVMVYNFISRKLFLEQRTERTERTSKMPKDGI